MVTRKRNDRERLRVDGSIWITVGGDRLGGDDRVELLRAVEEHGSITQAAKAFGMSYKAAWDAINKMNALSRTPLIERAVGGKGGGSTHLTDHGRKLIDRYERVDAIHQRFVELLSEGCMDLEQEFSLLKVLNMKTSARNQWTGKVSAVRAGAVNDEVEVSLPGGQRVAAIITRESTQSLGLKTQLEVIVLVKASSVLLTTDLQGAKISADNRMEGEVLSVTPGATNAEINVKTADGLEVVAIVTQGTVASLSLAPGVAVTAFVKASDVVLAVLS
ncbi:TOBE domain-containing protein [Hydrogenophaga sp.]|uniref:TOBE domain-containing protein n=1 Tax=Hydrogenophaga sp. TaxID=1904254 RepID=UPI002728D0A6|nr:TOBE domain-containing protein [Hydrogenophaga sp.]MDO9438834.1 TOBE domain-containing protein [Hydrogenophaga sp.]